MQGSPSFGRRAVNVLTNLVATDINRKLGDVLAGSGLEVVREEPSVFGGTFRVAIARAPSAR